MPPLPIDKALSQLVKGCQLAMHKVTLLTDENAKLQAAKAKQKEKRKGRSKYISRGGTLTIAQGQERLREPEVQVNTPVQVSMQQPASMNRGRLPSCYICYAYDHVASECPGA